MPASFVVKMFGLRRSRVDRVALRLESLGQHDQHHTRPAVSVFRRVRGAAPTAARKSAAVFVLATAA